MQLRRLNDTEKQQSPLRKKTKDYLTRNVELAAKNTRLTETLKMMQQQHADAQLKRSITGPNVHQLGLPSPATKAIQVLLLCLLLLLPSLLKPSLPVQLLSLLGLLLCLLKLLVHWLKLLRLLILLLSLSVLLHSLPVQLLSQL